MNPTDYVILAAILFTIGTVGVLIRRNAIVVFMCVELMLNAANLAFVAFARQSGTLDGQAIAFFVMVVAACEVVVGPAFVGLGCVARVESDSCDAGVVLEAACECDPVAFAWFLPGADLDGHWQP